MNRALITGGNGFIGRRLAAELVERGFQVTVMARPESAGRQSPLSATKTVLADLRQPASLAAAVAGQDLIFHCAANIDTTRSIDDPRLDFEINAAGTLHLLEAARQARVARVIYVSSAAVYGAPEQHAIDEHSHPTRPFIPYGASKLAGESYCLAYRHSFGLDTVIARPFCVYGPGEDPSRAMVEVSRFLRWHLNGQPLQVVGDTRLKVRDFVHVNDAAKALVLMASHGESGGIYNIGSGEGTSMLELAEAIASATNRPPTLVEHKQVLDDSYRLVANVSRLGRLGYRPQTELKSGVKDLATQLGENPSLPTVATRFRAHQIGEGAQGCSEPSP